MASSSATQVPCVFCLTFSSTKIEDDQDFLLRSKLREILTESPEKWNVASNGTCSFKGVDPWDGMRACCTCKDVIFSIRELEGQIAGIQNKISNLAQSLLDNVRRSKETHSILPLSMPSVDENGKIQWLPDQGLKIEGPSTNGKLRNFYKGGSKEKERIFQNWVLYRAFLSKVKSKKDIDEECQAKNPSSASAAETTKPSATSLTAPQMGEVQKPNPVSATAMGSPTTPLLKAKEPSDKTVQTQTRFIDTQLYFADRQIRRQHKKTGALTKKYKQGNDITSASAKKPLPSQQQPGLGDKHEVVKPIPAMPANQKTTETSTLLHNTSKSSLPNSSKPTHSPSGPISSNSASKIVQEGSVDTSRSASAHVKSAIQIIPKAVTKKPVQGDTVDASRSSSIPVKSAGQTISISEAAPKNPVQIVSVDASRPSNVHVKSATQLMFESVTKKPVQVVFDDTSRSSSAHVKSGQSGVQIMSKAVTKKPVQGGPVATSRSSSVHVKPAVQMSEALPKKSVQGGSVDASRSSTVHVKSAVQMSEALPKKSVQGGSVDASRSSTVHVKSAVQMMSMLEAAPKTPVQSGPVDTSRSASAHVKPAAQPMSEAVTKKPVQVVFVDNSRLSGAHAKPGFQIISKAVIKNRVQGGSVGTSRPSNFHVKSAVQMMSEAVTKKSGVPPSSMLVNRRLISKIPMAVKKIREKLNSEESPSSPEKKSKRKPTHVCREDLFSKERDKEFSNASDHQYSKRRRTITSEGVQSNQASLPANSSLEITFYEDDTEDLQEDPLAGAHPVQE